MGIKEINNQLALVIETLIRMESKLNLLEPNELEERVEIIEQWQATPIKFQIMIKRNGAWEALEHKPASECTNPLHKGNCNGGLCKDLVCSDCGKDFSQSSKEEPASECDCKCHAKQNLGYVYKECEHCQPDTKECKCYRKNRIGNTYMHDLECKCECHKPQDTKECDYPVHKNCKPENHVAPYEAQDSEWEKKIKYMRKPSQDTWEEYFMWHWNAGHFNHDIYKTQDCKKLKDFFIKAIDQAKREERERILERIKVEQRCLEEGSWERAFIDELLEEIDHE